MVGLGSNKLKDAQNPEQTNGSVMKSHFCMLAQLSVNTLLVCIKNLVHVPIWGVTLLFSVESELLPEMDTYLVMDT